MSTTHPLSDAVALPQGVVVPRPGDGGIALPAGHPGELRRASAAWGHASQSLTRESEAIRAVATAAHRTWHGRASRIATYALTQLGADLGSGAAACEQAATVTRHLAATLEDAQEDARAAIHQARAATDRIEQATRAIEAARSDAIAAAAKAVAAQAAAGAASALPPPEGPAVAEAARRTEQAARQEGDAARRRLAKAEALREHAHDDLRRARERGADANQRAREAGTRAGAVLAAIESAASSRPPGCGRYPLPVPGQFNGGPNAGTHEADDWPSRDAVDLNVKEKTNMISVADGKVVRLTHRPHDNGQFAGDGITIKGKDGNTYYYKHGYSHVKVGQHVTCGQVIGKTGSAKYVAHLHFAVKKGDPRKIIGQFK